jgi:hypothetical protein
MIWEADGRREELVEELEAAGRGLTAALVLVGFAALLLSMLPLAVLLSGANLDWLSPVLTSLGAILTGTKVVVAAWGVLRGVP